MIKVITSKTFIWVTIFSMAMGFLETAVVVYARALYFPNGFQFPLVPINELIALTELWREIATIVMLIGVGTLAGTTRPSKFAYFIYSFAIWDIFYYVFLKLILDWPTSLLTWDLLFLVPVTWVGPVLSPLIVAFTMVTFSIVILVKNNKLTCPSITLLTTSAFMLILSFSWDYGTYVFESPDSRELWSFGLNGDLFASVANYTPTSFNWFLFGIGEALFIASVLFYSSNSKKTTHE